MGFHQTHPGRHLLQDPQVLGSTPPRDPGLAWLCQQPSHTPRAPPGLAQEVLPQETAVSRSQSPTGNIQPRAQGGGT